MALSENILHVSNSDTNVYGCCNASVGLGRAEPTVVGWKKQTNI